MKALELLTLLIDDHIDQEDERIAKLVIKET
jgi:hypothetical protein